MTKEAVEGDVAQWYSPNTRRHTESIRKRILASRAALTGVHDPNVNQLDDELEAEKKNVHNWHQYGGQLQESKEEALKRALTYAHDSIAIGREIGNMKLVRDAVEVLAEIDGRYVIGEEGNEEFEKYSRWVATEINHAYNRGRAIKPSSSVKYMGEIETLTERLRMASKRRRDLEQFEQHYGKRSAHAASAAGFMVGTILLAEGITGNTIGGLSQTASNTVGLVLFILGLIGMFFASKRNSEE